MALDMLEARNNKPLGRKSYGSIGHLPGSRLGPGDHHVSPGQATICTQKTRDCHDIIVVQEKLDGSCTAVTLIDGEIIALNRSGYRATTSPYEQHHLFADWVHWRESEFRMILTEGERIVGEWLAQAHGTRYNNLADPWVAFDIFTKDNERLAYDAMEARIWATKLHVPRLLHYGDALHFNGAVSIEKVWAGPTELGSSEGNIDPPEGAVWRVERGGKIDFLAKWVRPDKIDGLYLPEISGKPAVWNWRLRATRRDKHLCG